MSSWWVASSLNFQSFFSYEKLHIFTCVKLFPQLQSVVCVRAHVWVLQGNKVLDSHWLFFKKQPNKTGQPDFWLECLSRKWVLNGCLLPRLFDVCDFQPWPFLVLLTFPCKMTSNMLGHFQKVVMVKLVTTQWWINTSGYLFIPIIIKKNRSSQLWQWLKVIW